MSFLDIANKRFSCRSYDPSKSVEEDKLRAVIEAGRLAPSACNSQPYHFTACRKEVACEIAKYTQGMGINKFVSDVPVLIVISEMPYNASARVGAKIKHNDYRSIDIGIAAAYMTAEAETLGLATCILGWFDGEKIQKRLSLAGDVRLIIAVGYAGDGVSAPEKKRRTFDDIVDILGE